MNNPDLRGNYGTRKYIYPERHQHGGAGVVSGTVALMIEATKATFGGTQADAQRGEGDADAHAPSR